MCGGGGDDDDEKNSFGRLRNACRLRAPKRNVTTTMMMMVVVVVMISSSPPLPLPRGRCRPKPPMEEEGGEKKNDSVPQRFLAASVALLEFYVIQLPFSGVESRFSPDGREEEKHRSHTVTVVGRGRRQGRAPAAAAAAPPLL